MLNENQQNEKDKHLKHFFGEENKIEDDQKFQDIDE